MMDDFEIKYNLVYIIVNDIFWVNFLYFSVKNDKRN